MPVCKFWSRGNCRFGEKCWYDHPRQESQYDGASFNRYAALTPEGRNVEVTINSYDQGQNYQTRNQNQNYQTRNQNQNYQTRNQNQNYQTRNQNQNFSTRNQNPRNDDLAEIIRQELDVWEHSQQWPYSIFSVLVNDKVHTLPGFTDMSIEEMKWEAYKAEQQNTQSLFREEVNLLTNDLMLKRQALKNMSHRELKQLFEKPQTNAFDMQSQFFKSESTHSTSPSASGNFSFRLNDHDTKSTTSASNFSFKLDNNAFGSNSTSNNNFSFSLDDKVNPPTSDFSSSAFQPAPQNVPFGFANNSSNAFPSFPNSSPAPPTSKSSVFASTGFGTSQNTFQNNQPVNDSKKGESSSEFSPYSKISELSETQVKQFKSQTFTVGKIPTLPPPQELCR